MGWRLTSPQWELLINIHSGGSRPLSTSLPHPPADASRAHISNKLLAYKSMSRDLLWREPPVNIITMIIIISNSRVVAVD